jgi:hypothetical protein
VKLLPERLDDFIAEDSTVRVIDAFIGELDMPHGGVAEDSSHGLQRRESL